MKNYILSILVLGFGLMTSVPSHAQSAIGVRTSYSSNVITSTGNWFPLISSTQKSVGGLYIFDSSGQTMQIGIAGAGSNANSEVQNIVVAPNAKDLFIPLYIPYGKRVSIKALSSTANSGESDITFIYQ